MRFQTMALTAALVGSALATAAGAMQVLRIQGEFETQLAASNIGPAPLAVDLTYTITSSPFSSGAYLFYASAVTGTIGGQAFTGNTNNNVAALSGGYGSLLASGTTANGDRLGFYLSFDSPNPALTSSYIASANVADSTLYFTSLPTLVRLYANFRVLSVTSSGTVPGTNGVPEPSSWAFMLTGFGVVGAAMRGRRKVRHSVNFS